MRESYLYSEIEKKTIEEKLDLIEKIENDYKAIKTNFKILELLSRDKDDEIRSRVAEALINFQFKESEEILKRLLNVNILGDILTNNNSIVIKECLVRRKKIEKSIAVISAISKVIKINCR